MMDQHEGILIHEYPKGHLRVDKIMLPFESHANVLGWGQDFLGAYYGRPWILRLIARLAMGKYAYRELVGVREAIEKNGYGIWDYDLEDMEYHQDRVPT